jgi:competence protein ComEC
LRVVLLAGVAWTGALGGFLLPPAIVLAFLGAACVLLVWRHRRGHPVLVGVACVAAGGAVACAAMLRAQATTHNPVAALAAEHAFVHAVVEIRSDPVLREGRFDDFVLVRADVRRVTGRGHTAHTDVPVLLLADPAWTSVRLGSVVRAEGRVDRADGDDLAAVMSVHRPPELVTAPGPWIEAAGAVRGGIRRAVSGAGPAERALVPALVAGDDQGMDPELVADFQASGLTHLSAVSGTNLTLVVGFLLVLARLCGVRARGLMLVGALGVVGFVLLARTEPSVVRVAAMGSVALLGMGSNGRERGTRALGVAVLVLLLFDPWLATSIGFALSALATAGILFLAPPWRDALRRWLPRWVAEAIAVPLAAQVACTPVVAAISGQVSLVAVIANLLVAPAVGPATVLGLVGGVVVLLAPPLGLLCGRFAGLCAWWIVTVARQSAALPTAAVPWSSSAVAVAALAVVCTGLVLVLPGVLSRRRWALPTAALLVVAVVRPLPTPGWPPDGWVLVACDVGQGDALVLNAGDGRGVLVDAGPDPVAVARCLDELGVTRLPEVVLSHFHADHVGGLPAVLDGWPVGRIEVTGTRVPAGGAAAVSSAARAAGVPVRVPAVGAVGRLGPLTWQVVSPTGPEIEGDDHGEEGAVANNASLALLVEVRGVRLLLSGDMEPEAQQRLHDALPGLRVDVLKVPHHGSRYQDADFLTSLGARLAVVSVGADNDYGHPAPETLDLLREHGTVVRRTDLRGDVAVLVRDGVLSVRSSG